MFEKKALNAISIIFEMPCIEYSGQTKNAGEIYLYWDDIDVSIIAETKMTTTAIATVSFVNIDGRQGVGFLSGQLFNFGSKPEGIKIEAIDHSESKSWLSKSKFECSKRIRITEEVAFNNSRELIKHFKLIEG